MNQVNLKGLMRWTPTTGLAGFGLQRHQRWINTRLCVSVHSPRVQANLQTRLETFGCSNLGEGGDLAEFLEILPAGPAGRSHGGCSVAAPCAAVLLPLAPSTGRGEHLRTYIKPSRKHCAPKDRRFITRRGRTSGRIP